MQDAHDPMEVKPVKMAAPPTRHPATIMQQGYSTSVHSNSREANLPRGRVMSSSGLGRWTRLPAAEASGPEADPDAFVRLHGDAESKVLCFRLPEGNIRAVAIHPKERP